MGIHKEGRVIIFTSLAVCVALAVLFRLFLPWWVAVAVTGLSFLGLLFIILFFRYPHRPRMQEPDAVFAPADGEVVVIEEVDENEYFKDKRIQVSVFMSLTNVHANWFPVGGEVKYFRHHHGKYMVAWHPKSSERNERTTIVVDTGREQVLIRQVAGFIARRIVSYAEEGRTVEQNGQCGFIKFGSRVDLLLPPDAKINVRLGQKVRGSQDILAYFDR